jgi:hypothetical protein
MQVASVWSEVLGIPQAQLRLGDNFFELGGTSATAVAVIARLQVSDQPLAVYVYRRPEDLVYSMKPILIVPKTSRAPPANLWICGLGA